MKAFLEWMKSHPMAAAIIFLLIIPLFLLGILSTIRSTIVGIFPAVGSLPGASTGA